jgi:hypothetical protein
MFPIDTHTSAEDEYINNLLQVFDVQAKYYDSILDGSVPGITFKIKNKGTKTLKSIEVTVYFKDANGKNIGEQKYYPVKRCLFILVNRPFFVCIFGINCT